MNKRAIDDGDEVYVPPGKRTTHGIVRRMLEQRYELGARVGRGTSGEVFRIAVDHYTDTPPAQPLVVKVMVHKAYDTAHDRKSLEEALDAEVSAYGRLGSHPSVARFVEGYHLAAQGGYLVLEECAGGTLDKLIRATPFTLTRTRKFARQLFRALVFFQLHRVVHRDIKPENLLIDAESNLRVADFGLAHLYEGAKSEAGGAPFENVVTTLWFRPPEIVLPELFTEVTESYEESDRLSHSYSLDIWSAGCVVAEMAAGRALFAADNTVDLLCRHTRELGTPSAGDWPEATLYIDELHNSAVALPPPPRPWAEHPLAKQAGEIGRDFLAATVAYVPRLRLCAQYALQHPFFDMENTNAVAAS
jgi:serine/threonine protein kinase